MDEIWKDVVGYDGKYQVSNLGNVKNNRGRILKPQPRKHGYLSVWLYGGEHISGRNGKQFSVHRLVAGAFIDNPNNYEEVNHIDENKQNNCSSNLEWCSRKQNVNHGTAIERRAKTTRNGKRSIPVYQYLPSGELVNVYPSMAEVQRSTGYRKGNIWKQMNGIYETAYGYKWAHERVWLN